MDLGKLSRLIQDDKFHALGLTLLGLVIGMVGVLGLVPQPWNIFLFTMGSVMYVVGSWRGAMLNNMSSYGQFLEVQNRDLRRDNMLLLSDIATRGSAWRPIDTAPRDMSKPILLALFSRPKRSCHLGIWSDRSDWNGFFTLPKPTWVDNRGYELDDITHWAELPPINPILQERPENVRLN
jgi:hypothetical protein